jgi:large subunit ribosomal protein L25
MDIPVVEARPRQSLGSRACRRLRREGTIPAVLYGRGGPNVRLALERQGIEALIGEHALVVEVVWDDQRDNAQVREIQYTALGDHVVHVDLLRISLLETIQVAVPVEPHGEAAGLDEGGVLELVLHEIEVECLPTAIPENIRVEVAQLEIGDNLTVADIQFPEGVVPVTEPEAVVVTVVPPSEVEEEAPAKVLAEPGVIGAEEAEEEPEEEQD